MEEKLYEIFVSIITNKIAPMLSEISMTKQAEKIDEQIREQINRENMEIDAEQIDRIIQKEYAYLSDFLNPNVQLPKALQREFDEKFYKDYRGYTISNEALHRYTQHLRTELYQLLSPENRILERTIELSWSNSIEYQKRTEDKIDLLITTQLALLEELNKKPHRRKVYFRPILGQIALGHGRYLIHKVTGPDQKEYIFDPEKFREIFRAFIACSSRMFLYGKGGIGKTEFLQNVNDLYNAGHSYLVTLGRLNYPKKWAGQSLLKNGGIFRQIREVYGISYSDFLQSLQNDNTVMLLDGINELLSSDSSCLTELQILQKYPCKILVTGRSEDDLCCIQKTWETSFQCFVLTTEDPNITNLQNKIGVECNAYLYDLVSVPMYYYILNELSEDGTFDFSQYVNRYQIINRLFQKAYVHGANRYRERKAYEIAVWLIFPWLSYQVALEHTAWPNQKGLREKIGEFLNIICKVQDSELIEVYQRAVGCGTGDGMVCSFFRGDNLEVFLSIIEDFTQLLQENGIFSREGLHQDIRDYGAAVYFRQCLQNLKDGCCGGSPQNNWEKSMMLHLDEFSNDTIDFILCGALEPQNGGLYDYGQVYASRFCQFPAAKESPARFLHWCEGVIQLGEELCRRNLSNEVYYMKVVDSFLGACRDLTQSKLETEDRVRLSKVLLKGVEFHRKRKKFSDALDVADLARKNLVLMGDPNEKDRGMVRLKYHKLRITLCINQDKWNANGSLSPEKMNQCRAQIAALEINAIRDRYLYSSNLLGLFYSFPTPFIRQIIDNPDYPKAFWYYYSNVFNNGEIYKRLQIIGSSLRGCAGLLIYGLVHINTNTSQDYQMLEREQLTEGQPGQPQTIDLEIAEQLLAMIQNVTIPLKHVYHGLIEMHQGNWEKALELFSLEKGERLAQVAVHRLVREQCVSAEKAAKFGFGQDTMDFLAADIESLRHPLKDNYGIDRIDPQHQLDQVCWVDPEWRCHR